MTGEFTLGEIDQISQMLGRLQADMEQSQRSRTALFEKVDQLAKDFSAHRAEMQAHMEAEDKLAEQVEKLGKRVGELETFKVKVVSYAAAFATFGGALGAKIGKLFFGGQA